MIVRQNVLFNGCSPESMAIELLRTYEPPQGYKLAFSGGKDSVVIKHLADLAGVKYYAQYSLTTVDPPELVHYIQRYHPDVKWKRPSETMWHLIVRKHMPPSRRVRYCCEVLKENTNQPGEMVVTGVRWQESNQRANRKPMERLKNAGSLCNPIFAVNPIISWSLDDVWSHIRENNIPYCSLYDEGFPRLGCIMCPMQGEKGMKRDAKRWPKYKEGYLRAFKNMLEDRERVGLPCKDWHTADEVLEWWYKCPPADDDGGLFT